MGNKNSNNFQERSESKSEQNFEYRQFLQLAKKQKNEESISQQHILQQYQCKIVHHKNKQIEGICINEICLQQNRRTFFDCINDKIHDGDNGKISIIKNADQTEQMIEEYKIGIIQQIDEYQFWFYFEQLEFCDEENDNLACIYFQELNKFDKLIKQMLQIIREIDIKQYISEQYRKNIGLFQYLRDCQKYIIKMNSNMIEYKKLKREIRQASQVTQYFKVEKSILEDIYETRKKKMFIIQLVLKSKKKSQIIANKFKNGNISYNQKEFLIQQIEALNEQIEAINEQIEDINEQENNFQHRISNHNILLNLYPKNANYFKNKGDALLLKEKYKQSISMYDQAIEINPKDPVFYNSKGNTLCEMKKYVQAIYMYNKAIELDPKQPVYYNNKGRKLILIIFVKGNALSIMKNYQYVILIQDQEKQFDQQIPFFNDEADYKQGFVISKFKKYEQAIEMYDKAIQLDPKKPDFYNNKGSALSKIKKYDQAIAMYNKAIKLSPNDALYYNNKGKALSKIKKFDQAIFMYNKAIQLDPKASYINNRENAVNIQKVKLKYDKSLFIKTIIIYFLTNQLKQMSPQCRVKQILIYFEIKSICQVQLFQNFINLYYFKSILFQFNLINYFKMVFFNLFQHERKYIIIISENDPQGWMIELRRIKRILFNLEFQVLERKTWKRYIFCIELIKKFDAFIHQLFLLICFIIFLNIVNHLDISGKNFESAKRSNAQVQKSINKNNSNSCLEKVMDEGTIKDNWMLQTCMMLQYNLNTLLQQYLNAFATSSSLSFFLDLFIQNLNSLGEYRIEMIERDQIR